MSDISFLGIWEAAFPYMPVVFFSSFVIIFVITYKLFGRILKIQEKYGVHKWIYRIISFAITVIVLDAAIFAFVIVVKFYLTGEFGL
ncbi:MAG: hypothetical protein ABJJ90_12365 [Lentilitoribacter sp.]